MIDAHKARWKQNRCLIFGIDDAIIAGVASAAVGAAASTYSANQANTIAQGNNATSNLFNMVGQLQNQGFNHSEAHIAREFNAQQAQIARDFNRHEAMENRAFQSQMSSTSYERAVTDMKRAGLNPMLAYSQGGASTPGGTAANINAANSPMASSGGVQFQQAPAFQAQMPRIDPSSALDAMAFKTRMENTEAQTDYMRSQTKKTDKETRNLDEVQEEIQTRIKQLQLENEGIPAKNYGYPLDNLLKELAAQTAQIDQKLKLGEITLNKARERLSNISARLDELAEKGAMNQQRIDSTEYGQKIRPIIKDATGITGTAEGVNRILRSRGR